MSGRLRLVEYLKTVRTAYNSAAAGNADRIIRIVVGNSGGDMDSVVSSIGFSYFNYINKRSLNDIVYPVISFPKEDLVLRRDIVFALQKAGIVASDLIFIDELAKKEWPGVHFEVNLVDHNQIDNETLAGLVKTGKGTVCGIIDHHADVHCYEDTTSDLRIIETCGSCSSLVAKHFLTGQDLVLGEPEAALFLSAILIDTSGLKQRVEQADIDAVQILTHVEQIDAAMFKVPTKELKHQKEDVEGFSVRDLLRKDYKEYDVRGESGASSRKIGISSMVISIEELLAKHSSVGGDEVHTQAQREKVIAAAVHDWIAERGLYVHFIMASFSGKENGHFRRQLLVAPFSNVGDSTMSRLTDELQLVPQAGGDETTTKVFSQYNTAYNRKKVAPLVLELFNLPE